jgi:hypothetical protein
MDKSAFQLFKNTNHTNTNSWLHNLPVIDFGRVIKVIDLQTVIAETVIQSSLAKEVYTVTLLNLSSALLEVSDEPKPGDTVLLLFLRRHHPLMFVSEIINDSNTSGYNKFSGVGILMSAAKQAAHTIVSCYEDDGKPVTDIKSDAEIYGTFNSPVTVEFCRAVFDSEDEQIINLVFGTGRPLVEKHLARIEREHGFWKDPENELIETDASVTEKYSKYAPITKNIQGAQTTTAGLGTDKDDAPVETDAPIVETVHGKAPVTRDIRGPQTVTVGIGNAETGDAEEERDAPVNETYGSKSPVTKDIRGPQTYKVGIGKDGDTDAPVDITLGEKADITLTGKSGLTAKFKKDIDVETEANDTKTVGGNKKEDVTGKAEYISADTDIVSTAPVGINDGLYKTGLQPYLNAETAALTALQTAAASANPQLAILDALSGGAGFITGLGTAIAAFCTAMQSADTAAHAAIAKAVK